MLRLAVTCFGLASAFCAPTQVKPNLDAASLYKNVQCAVVIIELYGPDGKVASTGSGFLVSSDGRILTNCHVIAHSKQATVRLANGDAYDTVDVISIDKRKDIALLKIQAVELPALKLGRSASMEVGHGVFSVSSPLGVFQNTLSQGIVSGIREMDGYRVFQISAPISGGSSGGPIFNDVGEVIGLATFQVQAGRNLNFAVPIDYARGMMGATQTQPLASVYEPPPAVPVPPPKDTPKPDVTPQRVALASAARLEEMKRISSGIYLERQLGTWTPEDAQGVLGDPVRHRFVYDNAKNVTGDIFAYPDPTRLYREFELDFDKTARMLLTVYTFPWQMTWDGCKKAWGDSVAVTRNPDGSRFYAYKNRRLTVYAQKDGTVISFFVY